MDESWIFLKEAPESELALVREACEKIGLYISSSDSADKMLGHIFKEVGLEAEDNYEVFLDEICKEQAIHTIGINLEEKETKLLEAFLAQGISAMSEEKVRSFAMYYGFSNIDREKLTWETRARIVTESRFRSCLPNLISMMFLCIDCSQIFPIFPVDKALTINNATPCLGVLSSVLIQIKREHQRKYDNLSIVKYVDNAFLKDCKEQKKSILSIILGLYELKASLPESEIVVDESVVQSISSYLGSETLELPKYIKEKVVDVQGSIDCFMEKLFPCGENEDEAYIRTCQKLFPCEEDEDGNILSEDEVYTETRQKTTKYESIAFFDYRFPYTQIPQDNSNCCFCIPKDEFEQKAVELYLLCQGKDASCLIDEENLKKAGFECAVIGREQSLKSFSSSFNNCIKTVNPISIGLELLSQKKEFDINEIQRLVVKFINLDHEMMIDICKEVEESKTLKNNVLRDLILSLTNRITSNNLSNNLCNSDE